MTSTTTEPTAAPYVRKPYSYRQLQVAIVLLALALRLLFNTTANWIPRSDSRDFHEYALTFLTGRGWVNYWMEHPAWNGFTIRQFHAPGYSAFLVAIYAATGFDGEAYMRSPLSKAINGYYPWPAVGFNPRFAYLAQVGLDLISLWLLGRMARRFFGNRAALITQLIFAFFVVWTPQLIAECLYNTLFVAAMYLLVENPDFNQRRKNIVLSLVLAAGLSVKMIGVVPVMIIGLMWLRKPSFAKGVRIALVLIPTMLYLGGMAYRAYALYGHPFIISTGGQHIAENTYKIDRTVEYLKMKQEMGRIPNEYETMSHYVAMSKRLIREQPMVAFRAYFVNLVDLCSLEPDWNTTWIWSVAWHDRPSLSAFHQFLFKVNYIIYPLGALGLILFWRRAPLIAGMTVFFLLFHPLVSYGNYRYLAPAVCLAVVFAGAAIDRLLPSNVLSPASGTLPAVTPAPVPAAVPAKKKKR
jgi:hypothetical protein